MKAKDVTIGQIFKDSHGDTYKALKRVRGVLYVTCLSGPLHGVKDAYGNPQRTNFPSNRNVNLIDYKES